MRAPGHGRYAQVEREQRWLLRSVPSEATFLCEITDRYLDGLRLRLRTMVRPDETLYKLCQKVRPDPTSPHVVKLTNIYLDVAEHDRLLVLPGATLAKTRWRLDVGGYVAAVDQFHGDLEDLVLAEVELPEDAPLLPLPSFAVRDVTEDDRFSGGTLAHTSPSGLAELLP